MYDNVRFVLSRTDILVRANADRIPPTLFGGYYELVELDADGQNAIYRRTGKSADEYQTDPGAFDENVAHVSYVRQATIDGAAIRPSQYQERLRFLHDETSELTFTGRLDIAVQFAAVAEPVRKLTAERVRTSEPATLRMALAAEDGRIVHQAAFRLERERPIEVEEALPIGSTASRLEIEVTSDGPARISLTDIRVHGQTPALERYIKTRLRFPPAPASAR